MNLLLDYQSKIFNFLKKLEKKKLIIIPSKIKSFNLELPPKNNQAHFSSNAAMIISKINNTEPILLAERIKKYLLLNFKEFSHIEIAKPGFLNIYFKTIFWNKFLTEILKNKSLYGSKKINKKKYNIEFVSANPTGPLHVGHCRGAVLGDALSNLLIFNGNHVIKEYYVNDYGGQIKKFVMSVYHRIEEIIKKKPFPNNNDLYPGDYVIDIAKKIIKKKVIKSYDNFNKINKKLTQLSLKYSMEIIINNLSLLNIKHNNFVYESSIVKKKIISKVVKKLQDKKFVYIGELNAPKGELAETWKARKQLLFKSSLFGDDSDRPLQKLDGSWTYFAGDLGYHSSKISRKFDILVNILGADHSGYIKRIVSATTAMSNSKVSLICKVSQLVKLYKNGQPFKMSKRKGDYITLEDLVNEVGCDSTRFMMLYRSNDVELDFDFEKVTEKSKDNPVFYVQYAYARINSIFRALKLNLNSKIKVVDKDFSLNEHELEIIKKISEWPRCVEIASNKLEPHRISFYLYELVTLFHAYWNMGQENKDYRFVNDLKNINKSRLALLQALSVVIENGMKILGVSTPKTM